MKRVAVIACFAFALFAMPDYFVLNGLGETLSYGNWLNAPINNVATTGGMPNQILFDDDGFIWVLSSGDASLQKFSYDGERVAWVRDFFMPLGSNPYLMFRKDNYFYVSLWVTGHFSVIDITSGVVETHEAGLLGAQGIYADDDYVFVTAGNFDPVDFVYGDGELWRFGHDGTAIDRLIIGTNPQQIISTEEGYLHIVCTGNYFDVEGAVYIIDKDRFEVVDSVLIGGSPSRLVHDQMTNYIYSATSVWGTHGSGRLLAYNAGSLEVLWSASDTENTLSSTGLTGLDSYVGYVYLASMDSSCVEIVRHLPETASMGREAIYTAGFGALDIALDKRRGSSVAENKSEANSPSLSVYPNPFRGSCLINANSNVEIYSPDGKLVSRLAPSSIWQPSAEMDAGVYLAVVEENGRKYSTRIVYIK